jgi:hypothetical protein
MTMSRALDELERADLGESLRTRRERCLRIAESKLEVWKKAQQFLRSPVRSCHPVQMVRPQALPFPRAGLSALAHHTRLAEPKMVAVALSREEWRAFQERDTVTETSADDPDGLIVEVWDYAPGLFAAEGVVDRLSLYLCLRETKDERVETALDELMADAAW